ncbi:hypothetical protein C0993_011923 [Termitomyces sp. T159_Od127]|nr:hypothetical protein C0993_011923 [Termitomyces sp. T159_Od127]
MSGQEQVSEKDKHHDATNLGKLPQDVVTKLSEKLSELMGEDIRGELDQLNNARGELLNEEGLPIIDITEPVATSTVEEEDVGFVEESTLPPLHLLPAPVRERLRQERNHLLDQLEEEERAHQKREESADMEHREDILRKRKEAAAQEKEKLKATREMHKKMGKMLLQNLAKEREEEEKARIAEVASDEAKRASQGGKSKKTVSFADTPDTFDDERASKGGDITPARLRATGRSSLLSSFNDLPMKMTVVERTPSGLPKLMKNEPDSDDESDPEAHLDDEDSDREVTLEDEEYDAEFAHHQREVALQYHEKREKIGAAALAALAAHSHDVDGHVRVDLPLDMPSSEPEKPSISQFKAGRLASSFAASSPSTSIGASVVPASAARTIQKTVRTGKIDENDQLVGGDADSASEDETTENAQELLNLLRKGELYNIGPDGNYLHVAPPSDGGEHAKETPSLPSVIGRAIPKDLTPIDRPKTSKFKLSRATGQPSVTLPSSRSSDSNSPVSVAERSSPKTPPPMASSVVERKSAPARLAMNPSVSERPPSGQAPVAERWPAVPANRSVASSAFPSMIVDSPSFPAPIPPNVPANEAASSSSPSPMIIDSPSFPRYAVSEVQSRPTRPPVVVSSATREASGVSGGVANTTSQPRRPDKVSRFMADRM